MLPLLHTDSVQRGINTTERDDWGRERDGGGVMRARADRRANNRRANKA